jgi:hypothetical protein
MPTDGIFKNKRVRNLLPPLKQLRINQILEQSAVHPRKKPRKKSKETIVPKRRSMKLNVRLLSVKQMSVTTS